MLPLPLISFQCAHCGIVFEETPHTFQQRIVDFSYDDPDYKQKIRFIDGEIRIRYHKCPKCRKYTINIKSAHESSMPDFSYSYPPAKAKLVPSCVPSAIAQDYIEACSIVDLSPKASATLARRCLQGMIHDFWGIHKKNLSQEISELEGKIPSDQWRVIDGLRRIGNIGAHMEADINTIVDIDADEALKLLKLIEFLFLDWYKQRHERETLYQDIIAIDQDKQLQRHPSL